MDLCLIEAVEGHRLYAVPERRYESSLSRNNAAAAWSVGGRGDQFASSLFHTASATLLVAGSHASSALCGAVVSVPISLSGPSVRCSQLAPITCMMLFTVHSGWGLLSVFTAHSGWRLLITHSGCGDCLALFTARSGCDPLYSGVYCSQRLGLIV